MKTASLKNAGAHQDIDGKVKWKVVDTRTGLVVRESPWQKNLILNQGMDRVQQTAGADLMLYCAAGTGVTPTSDDSGTTVAVQSGTTVTLSGGVFVLTDTATDAGKVIKWDSGAEATIVTVSSPTVAVVLVSATVASGQFTVYRTNQQNLQTEVKRSGTYLLGTGNTESVLTATGVEHRRTYDFTAEVGTVVYTEIGISWAAAGSATLFSRILLPLPVTVNSGQQLRIVYQLNVVMTPRTPSAKTATISGWPVSPATDTDGDEQLQVHGVLTYNTSGIAGGVPTNEPYYVGVSLIWLTTDSSVLAAFGSPGNRNTNASSVSLTKQGYTTGNYYVDKTGVFPVGQANRTDWRAICVGYFVVSTLNASFCFLFDQAQTKLNTHTLTLTFRFSWARTLS